MKKKIDMKKVKVKKNRKSKPLWKITISNVEKNSKRKYLRKKLNNKLKRKRRV